MRLIDPNHTLTPVLLKAESQAELNLPWSSSRSECRDYAKSRRSKRSTRRTVVLKVEDIEELRSELHGKVFRDMLLLHKREINVIE